MSLEPALPLAGAALLLVLAGTLGAAGGTSRDPAPGFAERTLTLGGREHRYQVWLPPGYDRARRWPVILFLHGAGERGTDNRRQLDVGLAPVLRAHPERFPAVVVLPQAEEATRWTSGAMPVALDALRRAEREFRTDRERVYLVGLSMGGTGAYALACREPGRYAAILATCGRVVPVPSMPEPILPLADSTMAARVAERLRRIPAWIFHGDADDVIPVTDSRLLVAELRALGAPVRYDELPGVNHGSWVPAFEREDVAAWLFAQRRGRR